MRLRLDKLRIVFGCLLLCAPFAVPAKQTQSPPVMSFNHDIQPIFDHNCAICHRNDDAIAGLTLERGGAYEQIVGAPSTEAPLLRIKPGSPEQSYLLLKVEGKHVPIGTGLRMPTLVFNQLPPADIARIRMWISQGARRN